MGINKRRYTGWVTGNRKFTRGEYKRSWIKKNIGLSYEEYHRKHLFHKKRRVSSKNSYKLNIPRINIPQIRF